MNNVFPIIRTEKICKHYLLGNQRVEVLHDISIDIWRGEYVAIMGHSGAGKSTLLHILGCLDKPSSGEYYFDGTSVGVMSQTQLADIRNREIGFVFQNFNLLPKLDVASNVELALIYGNVPKKQRKERVEEVLHSLGLWQRRKHKPNEISGGQKQRVAIARALVKRPSLILADEPTGNLDSHTTAEILELFDQLHNWGNTIVIITHEQDVASKASRRIKLIDGRVEQ